MNRDQISYYPALDGVRGWMAFGVLLAHVKLSWFPGAMILMELFFVISGFLITSIIWREVQRRGKIDLLTFWKRRLQRLYPVLLLVVITCTSVACLVVEDPLPSLKDALATLLYVSNFTKLHDYVYPTIFGQSWSLGIEEQFYLLWPLLFWAGVKFRYSTAGLTTVLICVAVACILWKMHLVSSGAPWSRLYYAPDTRLDAFVAGGLLALFYPRLHAWSQYLLPHILLIIGSCAFILLLIIGTPREVTYFHWQQSAAIMLSAMMVLLLTSSRPSVFRWLFSTRASIFFGVRCYSIYLWHWPVIWLLLVTLSPSPMVLLVVAVPSVLLLSCLSYRYVEQPFMAMRRQPTQPTEPEPTAIVTDNSEPPLSLDVAMLSNLTVSHEGGHA